MFIPRLESLRGIAALMVALGHCFLVFEVDGLSNVAEPAWGELPGYRSWITRLLLIIFNGPAAVTVFFVLSGYVLGVSLQRQPQSVKGSFAFLLRRVCRIYPVHLVALGVMIWFLATLHVHRAYVPASDVYIGWYDLELSTHLMMMNAALFNNELNPVSWTLTIEMGISVAIPLMYFIVAGQSQIRNVVLFVVLVGASWMLPNNQIGRFAFVFFLGLMLSRPGFDWLIARTEGMRRFVVGLSICILLAAREVTRSIDMRWAILLETLSAAILIQYLVLDAIRSGWVRVLDWPVVRNLGRYSFSFYLWHFIILYWLAAAVFKFVFVDINQQYTLTLSILLSVVSVVITYHLSSMSYRWVEMPGIRLGRWLTSRLTGPRSRD